MIVAAFVAVSAHAGSVYNPGTRLLTLDSVTVGANTYRNVAATINSYSLLSVAGVAEGGDSFDPATNMLLLRAVTVQDTTYSNVTARIDSYVLRSADIVPESSTPTPAIPGTPMMSLYAGSPGVDSPAGSGTTARFLSPDVLAVDQQGTLYIRDYVSLRKIPQNRDTSPLPPLDGTSYIAALTVARTGEIYYSYSQHSIGKLGVGTFAGPTPQVNLFAAPLTGVADGQGAAARFNGPAGLTTDSFGNVFVADRWNHTIRKITPGGLVTTFAGLAGVSGSTDGKGAVARFNQPYSLTIDAGNNLYLSGADNTIRRITPDATVSTLAGKAGLTGWADGVGDSARFSGVSGIAVSQLGNLYVADFRNHVIRKITQNGLVTTIAGQAGVGGYEMGALPGKISNPSGIAIYGSTLYFGSFRTVVRITDIE